jgi:hypothetical protein
VGAHGDGEAHRDTLDFMRFYALGMSVGLQAAGSLTRYSAYKVMRELVLFLFAGTIYPAVALSLLHAQWSC